MTRTIIEMLKAGVAAAAIAALLTTACGREAATRAGEVEQAEPTSPDTAGPEPAADPDSELDCEPLGTRILEIRPTRAALQERYGAPDSVRVSVEPNRHVAGATDSLFVVHYPGLEVHIRTPPGGRDLVSDVALESSRYLADPRIGIGASAADVQSVLGEPLERSEQEWTYECGSAVENPVTFAFRDGRVVAITISYYVD